MSSETQTLYIAGLPADLQQRELRNLFRFYQGFVACSLQRRAKEEGKQDLMAFCLFDSQNSAHEAKTLLEGTRFDYHDPSSPVLRAFFAKKKLGLPRDHFEAASPRVNGCGPVLSQYGHSGGYAGSSLPMMAPDLGQYTYQLQQQSHHQLGVGPYGYPATFPPVRAAPSRKRKLDSKPCSTLFIRNIDELVSDEQITAQMMQQVGYVASKINQKNGRKFVFIEFMDVDTAGQALANLNGYKFSPADPETLVWRATYSSTPFRGEKASKTAGEFA